MSLINTTIPGLYGGVSQQTPELRHKTQVTEMINVYPTIIGGVQKRPPSTTAYNDNTFPQDSFIYAYDRGAGNEQYIICINGSSQYRIFDIITNTWITSWTTHSYLAIPVGNTARNSFALSTVGDTTFIVNKTKTCSMGTTVDYNGDSDWDTTFYYWVKRTNGDTSDSNKGLRYRYYIYKNGVSMANTASTSGEPAVTTYTDGIVGHDSVVIATELSNAIGGEHKGSVVKKVATGTDIWSGSDSWGNQASSSWQGTIKKLQDLPNDFGFEGAVVEISGDENTNFDNYYVKYEGGVFKETYKPGLINAVNAATMPHKLELRRLTSTPTYHIAFSEIEWAGRSVGDEDSASTPSFIGQNIQDVFFYRNRLGFLAGDNVILSESGSYYNFFPTTVTDIIDSDPIDVAVDSNQAISLRYATPFNKELLLFGDKAQFVMGANDTLTPKNVSVQQSTAFSIKDVKPIVLGPNAYFVTEKNTFSGIREYYVQPDSLSNDAADISAHCPNYLPKNIVRLEGSSKNDMIFALSSDTPNTIYVYNFYWQGEEKAQSAWHKWVFSGSIFNIGVIGSNLLVMISRSGAINLEIIPLEFRTDFTEVKYEDATGIPYESKIVLSKVGFATATAKVDDTRMFYTIKNLKVNAEYGSFYNVVSNRFNKPRDYYYNNGTGQFPNREYITSKAYNYKTLAGTYPTTSLYPSTTLTPGSTTYAMNSDNKYPITGNVQNLEIEITNNITSGFRINTLDFFGNVVKSGKSV